MDMDRAIAFFEAIASRYDRDYALDATATRTRMARILRELERAPGPDVLDLGVGTGRELPALLDAGKRVTGIDASAQMIEICNKRARTIPIVEGDFYAPLPFPDESFDGVLALHGSLGHPPDGEALARLVGEVARVLRPGGVFAIEAPSPGWARALDAGAFDDGKRRLERVDAKRIRHEDRAAGVAIEAMLLGADEWVALLAPFFDAKAEAISLSEQLVVATRQRKAR
jgi:SAM-dependent methyltransferase